MPQSTDLVTDLPADFEVFGQAVATSMADLLGGTTGQILSKTTNTDMDFTWITNDVGDITAVTAGNGISGGGTSGAVSLAIDTTITADLSSTQSLANKTLTLPKISTYTTNGDLVYGTGSGVLSRLGIGTTSQVLTVSGGVPTWSAAPAASKSFSLLSTTTMTGSATITVSGLSGYDQIMVLVENAVGPQANASFTMRMNADNTTKYSNTGGNVYQTSAFSTDSVGRDTVASATAFTIGAYSNPTNTTSAQLSGSVMIHGANTAGTKIIQYSTGSNLGTGTSGQYFRSGGGRYTGTSVVSSVSFISGFGAFTGGTIYILGAA